MGEAVLVTTRSAWVAVATTSDATALLFVEFGSAVDEVTLAVSLIAVPAAVPAVTVTTYVMVTGEPGAKLGFVHVRVARVQVQPAGPVSDTPVVLAGAVSERVTLVAFPGPALVTTCVYVIGAPAWTGTGFGVFVTERSAEFPTGTLTVALLLPLLGSAVVELTESVWVMIVPDATFGSTVTTKVKFAVVFAAIVVVSVHVREARTQVHPAGPLNETAVVFAGSVSVSTGAFAVAGPEFVTLCV